LLGIPVQPTASDDDVDVLCDTCVRAAVVCSSVVSGLGAQADTCYVVSDQINVGDGHTVCGEEEVRKRTDNTAYTVRVLLTLVHLIAEQTHVIDIQA
jgi:hypothetical protein